LTDIEEDNLPFKQQTDSSYNFKSPKILTATNLANTLLRRIKIDTWPEAFRFCDEAQSINGTLAAGVLY
jgi:hypothetical protein